ncbi:hypothetical protein ACWC10_09450 [Streptomyces sp. NPDC001595]|uniref:hypothetical protein n=1 Tax=Streptomyces sp. NPDC001532 TaxID=3154520 RepID=UPI00331D5A45
MRVATRAKAASKFGARFAGVGLTAAVALGLAAGPAAAQPGPPSDAGVQPVEVPGNPTFASLDPEVWGTFDCEGTPIRIEDPQEGDVSGPVTITNVDDNNTFDFVIDDDFAAIGVIVKGGPNANVYDYRPTGIQADENLHAPINPNNGTFYGLSHIDFCLIPDGNNT